MPDKLVYIPNNDIQIYPFCRLQLVVEIMDTQLNEPTNNNPITIPQVVKLMNMKTLRTGVIKIQMSPPSLK